MNPLVRAVGQQFRRPSGPLGRLAARLMRTGNASLNQWMVDLLAIAPTDRVLEVGFGPGVTLAALLARATAGQVVGVDLSDLMVQQAKTRFGAEIAAGRLVVQPGDARALPAGDGSFDKVCAAHVLYFWPDAGGVVRELWRVLRPGGVLALAFQEEAHMPVQARTGLRQAGARLYTDAADVEALVRAAGFAAVRLETLATPDGPAGFCVLAIK